MAGYSATPLPKKLGLKPGQRFAALAAPENFAETLGPLPDGVSVSNSLKGIAPFDVIVLFTTSAKDLTRIFDRTAKRLNETGGFWVAWPKKSSGVKTDLTENIIRDIALAAGLVDNKVCAIDETWSGLRLVVRLKDRKRA